MAKQGEPLIYIVDVEHLKVGFDVLENEVPRYLDGAILTVSTVAFPSEQHPATISAVGAVDENGMVHVEATLNPHPHLAIGMTAFVTLQSVPSSNP
jgi:hypothetical protein